MKPEPFRVVSYAIAISVVPIAEQAERIRTVKHGIKSRVVTSDNIAYCHRIVRFAGSPQPESPYSLRYGTCGDGYVYPPTLHLQRAASERFDRINSLQPNPAQVCAYENHGKEVAVAFHPKPSRVYRMDYTALKAFDRGSRDAHFHLFQPVVYDHVSLSLDLSAYKRAGFIINSEPKLYFHPDDSGGHTHCEKRSLARLVPIAGEAKPSAIYTWYIRPGMPGVAKMIREGVVDVVWDVEPPHAAFIEIPPAMTGLDRVFPDARTVKQLQMFVMLAYTAWARNKGVFSASSSPDEIGFEKHIIINWMRDLYEFFTSYFAKYGCTGVFRSKDLPARFTDAYEESFHAPFEPDGFKTFGSKDEDMDDCLKLWSIVTSGGSRFHEPFGVWAYRLASEYLAGNGGAYPKRGDAGCES